MDQMTKGWWTGWGLGGDSVVFLYPLLTVPGDVYTGGELVGQNKTRAVSAVRRGPGQATSAVSDIPTLCRRTLHNASPAYSCPIRLSGAGRTIRAYAKIPPHALSVLPVVAGLSRV